MADSFLSTAQAAVDAGLQWAGEHEVKMTFVVLDVTGTVCAAARMDGSRTITYDIAVAKANTALAFQSTTADLATRVKIAFLGGGIPLRRGETIIGSVGVSGGTEEQDVECAEACALAAAAGE